MNRHLARVHRLTIKEEQRQYLEAPEPVPRAKAKEKIWAKPTCECEGCKSKVEFASKNIPMGHCVSVHDFQRGPRSIA